MNGKKLITVICVVGLLLCLSYYFQHPNSHDSTKHSSCAYLGTEINNSTNPASFINGSRIELSTELYNLKFGKLVFNITDSRIVRCPQDIPNEGGYVRELHFWQIREDEYIDYRDSNVLSMDGTFLENAYMVLVDVTVDSINATAVTDPYEGMINDDPYLFDNPYLFDCAMVRLADLGGEVYQNLFPTVPVTYFSKMGMCKEHPRYYYLEPGDSITFTLGFLVGGYREDGSLIDPSDLALGATMGETNAAYVLLGLEG